MEDTEGSTVNSHTTSPSGREAPALASNAGSRLDAWLRRQRLADAEEALSWLLNELRDLHDTTDIYVNVKEAERQADTIRDVLGERSGLEDVRQR